MNLISYLQDLVDKEIQVDCLLNKLKMVLDIR